MAYTRVTEEERNQIYALRQAGKGCNEIDRFQNDRPRECLDWKTPRRSKALRALASWG